MASLRALTAVFLGAFGAATVATGYTTYTATSGAIVRLVDERVEAVSRVLLSEARPGDAATILQGIDAFARRRDSGDIGFELRDARGRRLGGNVIVGRALPIGTFDLREGDGIAGLTAGHALVRDAGGGLRLVTIAETEPIDGLDAARLRIYLIGFGAMVLIVMVGTGAFGLLVRRRIAEVRATAEAIIDGDMARRVPVDPRGGVFAAQAVAFNRMLDRIAALLESVRNVSSDIAHDLRTPLARLHARLTRLAGQASSAEIADELDEALAQCDELMAMFAAILRIAEVEGERRRAAFAAVDVSAIVTEVAEAMVPIATEGDRRLIVEGGGEVPLRGDGQLLSQAAFNLVENALNHTPPGTTVWIGAARAGTRAILSVRDDGPGIAPADRAAALRRFGRLDASRHQPGHGLGLPLIDAVARLHRGTLTLADGAPGLIATLDLPAS